jgi:glycosyltransferase involved in cell wall biosynthesis
MRRPVTRSSGAPKVTLVTHRVSPVGGMEQMTSRLVEGLLAEGFEVTVVARRCELPPHPRLRSARVPAPARPFLLMYPWFFVVGSIVTWARRRGVVNTTGALVFNRADVSTVHLCHHGLQAKTGLLRASRPGPLYRLNARGAAWLSRVAERWCYRPKNTRLLVAVSRGVAAELDRWLPEAPRPIDVIPNGVDRNTYVRNRNARARIRRELSLEEGDLVALFVGGDWERKGLQYAIEAVARAGGWRLMVVGGGDIPRHRGMAEKIAPGRVSFVGEKGDTTPYYAAADAFVFPTAYEAFPVALLEAASSSLPLLVTPVSGAEDLVVDGHNGWFIDRDAEVIAQRLRQLGDDRELMQTMGAAAREATAGLTWQRVAESYAALYSRMDGD